MALNNLLASPSFAAWREGEPLDVARLLRAADGRPRLSIVYTAHLSDARAAVRHRAPPRQGEDVGAPAERAPSTLRALVYIDEIFGYFPPHPANPPTKRPLLTLLKQARAQGVGVVLATQNPVDLDYKGLANIGLWLVGRLQTEQDRDAAAGRPGRHRASTRRRSTACSTPRASASSCCTTCTARAGARALAVGDVVPARAAHPRRDRGAHARAGGAVGDRASDRRPRPRARRVRRGRRPPPSGSAPPDPSPGCRRPSSRSRRRARPRPFVLVKYAVRYKGLGETIATRAYPAPLGVAGRAARGRSDRGGGGRRSGRAAGGAALRRGAGGVRRRHRRA